MAATILELQALAVAVAALYVLKLIWQRADGKRPIGWNRVRTR